MSNYIALMVPWEGKIKDIESYFGSVVASYFTFLRWLFWINFIMSLICGVCIIMPEVMFGPDMGSVDYKSVPGKEAQLQSIFLYNIIFVDYRRFSCKHKILLNTVQNKDLACIHVIYYILIVDE